MDVIKYYKEAAKSMSIFEEKKEITDEETRVIKRIVSDLLMAAYTKNIKLINKFLTLQELKNIVAHEVFWHPHKMRLNVEKIYLGVLEGLFIEDVYENADEE